MAKKAVKKSAKKAAAKSKSIQKVVKGSVVTVSVKKKTTRKDAKSCTRIDVGGGRVAEVCVHPKAKAKPKTGRRSKDMTDAYADELGIGRMSAARRAELDADRDRLLGTAASDGVRRPRKARKSRKGRRKAKR